MVEKIEPETPRPAAGAGSQATKRGILNPVRIFGGRHMGYRTLKMVRARCDECQARDRAPGWWYRCQERGHNPYFSDDSYATKVEDVVEPDEAGDLIVVKQTTKKVKVLGGPNLVAVPHTGRHYSGDMSLVLRKARGKGWIMPEELDLPHMCEYSETGQDCWATEGLREYPGIGTFCSDDQARAVAADQRGEFLEVLNEVKKANQWASIAI